MVENVRYFTVKCEFGKMIFDKEKARKPLYIKDFRTFLWQGQKDLNPRHAVLETAALPTELYPYIKYGGPSGTRTPDQPVMSRLL